jgi:hypothetical protein
MKQQKYHMILELVKQNLGKHGKSHPHLNTTYNYKDEGGICHCYRFPSIQPTNTRMRVGNLEIISTDSFNNFSV